MMWPGVVNRSGPGFDFTRIRVLPDSAAPPVEAPPEPAAGGVEPPPAPEAALPSADLPSAPAAALPAAALPSAAGAAQGPGSALDSCARLHWDRGGRVGSYRAAGYAGYAAGLAVVLATARLTGAAPAAVATVAIVVPVSFLLAVRLSQAVFGYERIVFFEKALFALAATALALLALGLDIGRGLDLAALGIGTFLGFGRVGCLMVGCCHGRPSRWGIRYGVDHAHAGFPWYHVDRRLFPIQLVDGLASLVLVGAGIAAARSPHPPGALAAGYLLAYSAVRFVEELFRGDAARPRWLGLSEAQWTAALLAVGIAALARWRGPARLELAVASLLASSALSLALARRRLARTAWGLTSPWHIEEIHHLLLRLERGGEPSGGGPRVLETSQGLCVSLRLVEDPPALRDYVLSFADRALPLRAAAALTRHVRFGRDPADDIELRAGATPGLVHVLVWTRPPGPARIDSPLTLVLREGNRDLHAGEHGAA